MPALGLIKWRNAHQPVHTNLALQQSERVLAVDSKRCRFEPGLFTRLVVVENGFKALPLGPSEIHAQEHVGPILRFGTAGTGMNGHNGIARVVFPREQRLGFQLVEYVAQRRNLAFEIAIDVLAFFGEIEIGGNVVTPARQVGIGGEDVLQALLFTHHLLRTLRIRPQIRVGGLFFNFG